MTTKQSAVKQSYRLIIIGIYMQVRVVTILFVRTPTRLFVDV